VILHIFYLLLHQTPLSAASKFLIICLY